MAWQVVHERREREREREAVSQSCGASSIAAGKMNTARGLDSVYVPFGDHLLLNTRAPFESESVLCIDLNLGLRRLVSQASP